MDIKVGKTAIAEATQKLKNWGRWGKDDQVGTLNHVTPQDIVKAASLIRTGKVFALGIPLDANGPQNGLFGGRFNPIHQMLATGTDAVAERQDWNKIRYADDTLMLCVQGATHWDALGHVFYEDKAFNGHDAKLINSKGLNVLGIEHSKNKMVGRGVLLDIARYRGVKWMQDGESISNDELDKCAKDQNVAIGRGDFVIIRTGQMERCLSEKKWAATPAATRRASSSRTATGARRRKSQRSAPTPGASKCGPTRPRTPTSRGTGWSSRPWVCAWARFST